LIAFRQCDWRWPFLWETNQQPEARWHGPGEGPVHYLADTPDGAWAELVRHEEITDPEDLATLRRNLWTVEIPDLPTAEPDLPPATSMGPPDTYPDCQAEARRLREGGERGLVAPSAALRPGEARGSRVDRGIRAGGRRDGRVIVLFGPRPDLIGWLAAERARPPSLLLGRVRHFQRVGRGV
jgi:hypothetical protein